MKLTKFLARFSPALYAKKCLSEDMRVVSAEANRSLSAKIRAVDAKNEYFFWLSQRQGAEPLSETKKRVFLNLPKAEGDLRCIQLGSSYILRRIKKLCEANNIHFWLCYGALLGAIRHHGFIPWDDDIDIGIMREDLARFWKMIEEDPELNIHHYHIPTGEKTIKIKHQESDVFWVDLFLFDRVDAPLEKRKECENILTREYQKMKYEVWKLINAKGYSWEYKDNIVPEFDICREDIFNRRVKSLPFYGTGNQIVVGFDNYHRSPFRINDLDDYFPLVQNLEFEGESYCAPKRMDLILFEEYGDFWAFPPHFLGHQRVEKDLSAEYDFLEKHM